MSETVVHKKFGLPIRVYMKFTSKEVESWKDAKGMISTINATIGGLWLGIIGASVIGAALGKIITDGVYLYINKKHKEYGQHGLIIVLKAVPDMRWRRGWMKYINPIESSTIEVINPDKWTEIENDAHSR